MPPLPLEEARTLVRGANWYHGWEILPGLTTPGSCRVDPGQIFDELGVPPDLSGLRVLDIGSWDGMYAFELEARGAEVVAADIQDPDRTAFNTARRILGSRVEYVRASVYELVNLFEGPFDMVVFFGVFYHLKHPLLAFEQLNGMLRGGGALYFEGEVFSHYAETKEGKRIGNRLRLSRLAYSRVPLTVCYPGHYKRTSNWFVPNGACLETWLEASGFRVDRWIGEGRQPASATKHGLKKRLVLQARRLYHVLFTNQQRVLGSATKISDVPTEEHPLM